MVGYEVLVNGERRFTMVATDLGVLSAHVDWTRVEYEPGKLLDTASVRGNFQEAKGQDVTWSSVWLKAGDEVTIRLVQLDADIPGSTVPHKATRYPPPDSDTV